MDLVPYAIPFFFLAIVVELSYGYWRKRNTYRLNDSIGSLFMGTLRTASKLVFIGAGGAAFYAIEQNYALWRMDTTAIGTWVLAFVGYDLCYYWNHRIGHERQIFWASHVAHHQSEDYNLTTALRQTSSGFLLGWVFYIPMFLAGVPATVFVTVASANLIYQFWVHTEHIPKLGWYEAVFVTPSNHRVHHAQNDIYVDRNYGGVFILWDRLFGTFQEEREDEACIYGIRGPLHTFSPLWANLHIYVAIVLDAWRAQRWRDKLYAPFAVTGWRPVDVAEKYPKPKYDPASFQKYDPRVSPVIGGYAMIQLLVVVAVGIGLLAVTGVEYLGLLLVVSMIAFTMVCTARWLDGRPALVLELARLVLLLACAALAREYAVSTDWALPLLLYSLLNLALLPLLSRSVGFQNQQLVAQE
jgi:alkylglycerol monooxygenase